MKCEEPIFRGCRCPKCLWALYDGDYCQNPSCEEYGKSITNPIRLSTEEAIKQIAERDGRKKCKEKNG